MGCKQTTLIRVSRACAYSWVYWKVASFFRRAVIGCAIVAKLGIKGHW